MVDLSKTTGLSIFAKAEFLNPGGSIKDRIAKNMLEVAEAVGSSIRILICRGDMINRTIYW